MWWLRDGPCAGDAAEPGAQSRSRCILWKLQGSITLALWQWTLCFFWLGCRPCLAERKVVASKLDVAVRAGLPRQCRGPILFVHENRQGQAWQRSWHAGKQSAERTKVLHWKLRPKLHQLAHMARAMRPHAVNFRAWSFFDPEAFRGLSLIPFRRCRRTNSLYCRGLSCYENQHNT